MSVVENISCLFQEANLTLGGNILDVFEARSLADQIDKIWISKNNQIEAFCICLCVFYVHAADGQTDQ